jgi:hypothetical protein
MDGLELLRMEFSNYPILGTENWILEIMVTSDYPLLTVKNDYNPS